MFESVKSEMCVSKFDTVSTILITASSVNPFVAPDALCNNERASSTLAPVIEAASLNEASKVKLSTFASF